MSGIIRTQIGRLKARLIHLVSSTTPLLAIDHESDEYADFDKLHALYQKIAGFTSSINSALQDIKVHVLAWSNLMQSLRGDEAEKEATLYDQYVTKYGDYSDAISQAESSLDSLRTMEQLIKHSLSTFEDDAQPKSTPTTSPISSNDPSSSLHVEARLPRLHLRRFSGILIDWQPFWECFKANIHSKTNLEPYVKFTYLLGCLDGEAKQLVNGLPLDSSNYAIAVDLLKQQYDDVSAITHSLRSDLLSAVSTGSSNSELLSLLNELYSTFMRLENLGDEADTTFLAQVIQSKFPRRIISRVYRNLDTQQPSAKELLDEIRKILRQETAIDRITGPHTAPHGRATTLAAPTTRSSGQRPTSSASRPQGQGFSNRNPHSSPRSPQPPPSSPYCTYCASSGHHPSECSTVPLVKERIAFLTKEERCKQCLRPGHRPPECTRPPCFHCRGSHHRSVCYEFHVKNTSKSTSPQSSSNAIRGKPQKAQKPKPSSRPAERAPPPHAPSSSTQSSNKPSQTHRVVAMAAVPPNQSIPDNGSETVLLMCAPITLRNPDDSSQTVSSTVLLDSGSTRSYISEQVASDLKLQSQGLEQLSVSTFGSAQPIHLTSTRHRLGLQLSSGEIREITVTSASHLTGRLQTAAMSPEMGDNISTSLPLSAITSSTPGILLGSDVMWDFILHPDTTFTPLSSGFKRVDCPLGTFIVGNGFLKSYSAQSAQLGVQTERAYAAIENPPPDVDILWKLDSIGITDDPNASDDTICRQMTMDTIVQVGDRYAVKWPYKSSNPRISSNLSLCYARLQGVLRSLRKDPVLLAKYSETFVEQEAQGIIERVDLASSDGPLVHYLPHHGVVNPKKLRIVFDGSAKQQGFNSLNEELYRGPVTVPHIAGILTRARFDKYILVSDIEKAFLQVALQLEDRDVCRFLWLKDPSQPLTQDNLLVYRFCRVPFGIISSPWLLSATIEHHLHNVHTPLASTILRNLYVDNVLLGASDAEHAQGLYNETRSLFAQASMNLRDWASNNPQFNDFLRSEGEIPPAHLKLLGILWHTDLDHFEITVPHMTLPTSITKRTILQYINAIFDPLGWISPVILHKRLFLQTLWREQLRWDDPLPPHYQTIWEDLNPQASPSTIFHVPRLVSHNDGESFELHIFCDASAKAYGAAAYLRVIHPTMPTRSFLLFSKSRVSPTTTMTIPKLELTALLLGVRIFHFLVKELEVPLANTVIWGDSQCVLHWVRANRHVSVYVDNRVREIRSVPPDLIFAHIPTEENPADILSRGMQPEELQNSSMWWNGPERIRSDDPLQEIQVSFSIEDVPEPELTLSAIETNQYQSLICYDRFSTFDSLLNTLILILLFLQRIRKSVSSNILLANPTSANARFMLFKMAQTECPPDDTVIRNLHLYLDDHGLWRSRGRIDSAALSFDTRNPIYLPRDHKITSLYILHVHSSAAHAGVNQCLSDLRRTVWIPKARSKIKSVIRCDCFHCRKLQSLPYKLPDMPPLPESRTIPTRPFSHIGVDYMGPFSIRNMTGSIVKTWIVIFTCMFSRAIHCEVVPSYNAEGFIQAFRRFVSRRGKPILINSDHGTQLVLCASTLQSDLFRDFCNRFEFKWTFNTEKAPWKGSHFERLIGIFKSALRHALGRQVLDRDNFLTTVTEIEAIVNSRPLTYISDDIDLIPLRPCDFLIRGACMTPYDIPPFDSADEDYHPTPSSRERLLAFWSRSNVVTTNFLQQWTEQYLLSLREHSSWTHKQKSTCSRTPCVGDVVLIEHDQDAKTHWRLGKIISFPPTVPIREATIRTHTCTRHEPNIEFHTTITDLTRPINMLYPLELTAPVATPPPSPTLQPPPELAPRRSSRIASLPTKSYVFFAFCILLASPTFALSSSGQCPSYTDTSTSIHLSACSLPSYSIHRIHDAHCWIPQTCLNSRSYDHYCRSSCHVCPVWSTYCTDYSGRYVQWTLENADLVNSTVTAFQSEICSWKSSPQCDSLSTTRNCVVITLLDNTSHYLTTSTIRITDFSDIDPPICIGEGDAYGPPTYCAVHPCSLNGTKFCYFDQPGLHFLTGVSTAIPLKAYGYAQCTFYAHPPASSLPSSSHSAPNSSVICVDGGIQIGSDLRSIIVEVCIYSTCSIHNLSSSTSIRGWTLPVPLEMTQWDFPVATNIWSNGIQIFHDERECRHTSFCRQHRCHLCWSYLSHFSQCASAWEIILLTLSIIACLLIFLCVIRIIMSIYICGLILARVLKFGYVLVLLPYRLARFLLLYLRCRRGSPDSPMVPSSRRRIRRRVRTAVQTTVLLMCIAFRPLAHAWDQVAHLDSSSTTCSRYPNGTFECSTSTSHLLTLRSASSSVGLTLTTRDNIPVGSLTLRYTSLTYQCNRQHQYYTRNHLFEVHSVKRCPMSGSCANKEHNCAHLPSTSTLPEFDSIINESPGYSYCAESSGCWIQGCGLCTSACLFYRIIAVPRSNTVYQVFTCPSFRPVVALKVSIDTPTSSTRYKQVLQPGVYTRISDALSVSLVSTSVPHTPLLGSSFLRNMDTGQVGLVSASPVHQPQPGLVGQLQCSSRHHAVHFNCTFTSRVCQCRTTETNANCDCSTFDLNNYFSNPEIVLPVTHGDVLLHPYEDSVSAVFTHSTSFQLQVDINKFLSSFTYDHSTCTAIASPLVGCFNCVPGARSNITCSTDFGSTLGLLSCGDNIFSIPCSPQGSPLTLTFHQNRSATDIACQLKCPASRTSLHVRGQLFDVTPLSVFGDSSVRSILSNVSYTTLGSFLNNIHFPSLSILSFITSWLTYLRYVGFGLLFILLLYVFFQFRSCCILFRFLRHLPKKDL